MRRYLLTFAALLLLTGLTLGLSFASLGAFAMPVALLIAAGKSLLVALFFMHLVEHGGSARLAFIIGIAFALLLIVLATLDVVSRASLPAIGA
jgi:cytochrome c oxidase subunit IV